MESKLNKALALFFFTAVILYFMPPVIDIDFPWHLKTGEYIYQHREIPKTDPFSIVSPGGEDVKFFLSQYWLGQLIFYWIYSFAGLFGIVMLRSMLLAGIFVILWFSMKNTPNILKIGVLYITAALFLAYIGERPQLFSFLFGISAIAMLEGYRKTFSVKSLIFLPLMMLLWANIHGGYIFGDAAIAVFCFFETVKYFFIRKSEVSLPPDKLLLLLAFGFISIVVSYINPNSYQAIPVAIGMGGEPFLKLVKEYASALTETRGPDATNNIFIYWLIMGYSLVLLSLNLRRLDITHLGLVFFTLYLSLTAIRFVPFFVMTALLISGQYQFNIIDFERFAALKRLKLPAAIISLLLVLFWAGSLIYSMPRISNLNKASKIVYYPEGAVQFLLNNAGGGRIFNSHNTGSYLLWRLYPVFQTFVDTRGFNAREAYSISTAERWDGDRYSFVDGFYDALPKDYGKIEVKNEIIVKRPSIPLKREKWIRLLDKYNIDIIVHEATNIYSGHIYPIILRMIKEDQWKLVYSDGVVLIFVRDAPRFKDIISKYELDKSRIYDQIGMESAHKLGRSYASIYSSLAFALLMKGSDDKTVEEYIGHALYLNPKDFQAIYLKAFLELKRKKGKPSS